ncbi:MAG: ArsR family transcriptional regulator, partial [Thaumarchaeota archaeon]|nr:ArsR family transcriptional regulator [Nitrososphaerota archaeon]
MNSLTLLKCICDETRFNILELLQKNKELCVNDLVSDLKKDQPL